MSAWRNVVNAQTAVRLTACITVLLLPFGHATSAPAAERAAEQPSASSTAGQLIPRSVLFGNPDKANPQISPDGTQLSFLAPVGGVLNVWVGPADNPAAAKPVTEDRKRGIRSYFWAHTGNHLIYLQDKDGDENWHVYVVDLKKGETRNLTPLEEVRAEVKQVSHKHPEEILIGLNDRNPQLHDLYRFNIVTGQKTLLQKNTGFIDIFADDDYNVRFAVRMTLFGAIEAVKMTESGRWETYTKIDMEDTLTTQPLGFDKTGDCVYMMDSRGRNTAALTRLTLETGELELIAEDPTADLAGAMIHPTEKTVQAAAFTHERKRWQILDSTVAPDFDVLRTVAEGDIEVVSRTLDDRCWIVAYIQDNGPVRYYRYDRREGKPHFLFTNRSALEDLALAEMRPVVIPSRDGLNLVSYLTLPVGADTGRPVPMVLYVHGGPWARDYWGYNPIHQWLANRGYAVLSVNYRGSTGFGKSFINASNKEWAGKMHDDLIDAVRWAVKGDIADEQRVAIFGGSYGGYATLVGMTFTPEIFACGVDIVGPSNLVTLLNSIPPYWAPVVEMWATRVGDHRTEDGRAFLMQRSPLTYVDRIQKPLLIGQGANDPRVKRAESDQIVNAMQEKNIPVTYVVYSDEGHGFARPENSLSFFAVAEAFLAEVLGGRCEPIGKDFEGSAISVPAGAHYVPGLTEALAGEPSNSAAVQ
jgi:dipeptidyl aminopeptidase/acylaminoacyl peptidase